MSEEIVEKKTLSQKWKERRNKPKSKVRKAIEWVLFAIFGLVFAFILAGNISGMIHKKENFGQSIRFGWGSFVVLTDSMEPEYPVNSTIITYKEDAENIYNRFINEEDITIDITFFNEYSGIQLEDDDFVNEEFKKINGGQAVVSNAVMTHRLREVHLDENKAVGYGRYIFVTAGINNEGVASKLGQYQVFTEKELLGVVRYKSVFLGKVFTFVSSPVGLIVMLLIPAFYLIITSSIDIFKAVKEDDEESPATEVATGSGDNNRVSELSDKDRERLKQELLEEMINKKKGDNK